MAMLEREPQGRRDRPRRAARADRRDGARSAGLIVLISDLLAPTDALTTRLGYLRSRGHDVDRPAGPRPGGGRSSRSTTPAMFHDVESGRELYIDPDAARAEYLRRFAAHAAEIERACVDLGIEFAADHAPTGRWSWCSSTS